MANLPQQDTIKQYLADGVQTGFVTNFFVPLEDDGTPNLDVYVQPAGQSPVPESDIQTWNVDYTYTPNLDPISGGTVNFIVDHVPANGDVVTLVRDVQASLDVEFSNATTFSGQNLDDALDKLLLIEQQNKTYALQRNLSYRVNSYLPDVEANTQLPTLGSNQVWMGSLGGIIAATLEENPDVSTLRSELENADPGTDGARLIGYYDVRNSEQTTVDKMLQNLQPFVGLDSGSANALKLAIDAEDFALHTYDLFLVKAAFSCTGASTFSLVINGGAPTTPVAITDQNGVALKNNMIVQGQMCVLIWDGTQFQLINPTTIFYGGSLYMANQQTVPGTTTALVAFSTANLNPVGLVDVTQNGFVINKGGYYRVNCNLFVNQLGTGGDCSIDVHVNTITVPVRLGGQDYNGAPLSLSGSAIIHCAVNDIVNVYFTNSNASSCTIGSTPSAFLSNLDIEFIGY